MCLQNLLLTALRVLNQAAAEANSFLKAPLNSPPVDQLVITFWNIFDEICRTFDRKSIKNKFILMKLRSEIQMSNSEG